MNQGYYLTRNHRIAKVESIRSLGVWPVRGTIGNETCSWTLDGGASSEYSFSEQTQMPKYHSDDGLIKEISKEDNPEYFL